ncbi:MAG TPA: BRCT domain-containing protein [Clostridia bacterium]|nr:BRCT domain-containing protein [Clostridia bacterium]
MIGLLRGIVADDIVSPREVEKLAEWLLVNQEASVVWPIDVVLDRVGQVLEDGIIDDEEREDLLAIISEIVGAPDHSPFETLAASLPLTRPAPPVRFEGRVFVVTGRFAWGSRSKLMKEITAHGGVGAESITRKTDYLVIGTFGSRDWLHGSYGTKIQNAIDYAGRYGRLAIISEEHWINSLVG